MRHRQGATRRYSESSGREEIVYSETCLKAHKHVRCWWIQQASALTDPIHRELGCPSFVYLRNDLSPHKVDDVNK